MVGKITKSARGWERIRLTDVETNEVNAKLMGSNLGVMELCWRMAEKFLKDKVQKEVTLTYKDIMPVALALFEKQATQSFTAIMDALEQKVHDMKNAQPNPDFKPSVVKLTEEQKKEMRERAKKAGMEVRDLSGESEIEKAMTT